MKTKLSSILIGACLTFCYISIPVALSVAFVVGQTGCSTLQKITAAANYETSTQTAEQIIASAEKTAEIAALTFDEFLRQERKYSNEIKQHAPAVHKFAESLRKPVEYKGEKIPTGVSYLKKLRAATEAFRENRTPEGQASLRTAVASVKSLLDQTKSNLSQIPALKGP